MVTKSGSRGGWVVFLPSLPCVRRETRLLRNLLRELCVLWPLKLGEVIVCFFWYQKTKQRTLKARYTNVLFQIYLQKKPLIDAILENSNASILYFYKNNSTSLSPGRCTNEDQTFPRLFSKRRNLMKRNNPIFPLELLLQGICIVQFKT